MLILCNCIIQAFKLVDCMFVNPPLLLIMGEESFGMNTNYFLVELIELTNMIWPCRSSRRG